MVNAPSTRRPRQGLLLLATLALLVVALSINAPTVEASTTPSAYGFSTLGSSGASGSTPTPTVKTPKPSKTKKAHKHKAKTTSAPAAAASVETADDASLTPAPVATTKAPVKAATNATLPSSKGGKCVTGDPTEYISKQYVDWIWTNRMEPHFGGFTNFIFDQLMTNKGKLSYCVRWDSTNKLPKATASKFKAMLERQYAQWNKWLVGYGCWPFDKIEIEMVGVAVRDKALLDWSDDSLGPIYEKVLDDGGIPMCPDACYKHRNFEKSSDTSACKGKPFDISLWPTLGQGGGAGGDWGQRVDEANMISSLDADTSQIVAHEIGHGFGLPDFYEESDKPGADMPKMIMEAGASMTVTEGDGWLIRRGWENVRSRWPETSG